MAEYWWRACLLTGASFFATAALMPFARRMAWNLGIVDSPAQGKLHSRSTPCSGGPAMLLVVFGMSWALPEWSSQLLVLMLCTLTVCGVGLVDDLRPLGPGSRVVVEMVAGTTVLLAGPDIQLGHGVAYGVFTIAWIVLLTNSFNLLDNMDGCAGVVALVTAAGLAVGAGLEGNATVASLAGIIAGTCGGFLVFNWPPARLFMGDAGSLSLGFLLAVLALSVQRSFHGSGLSAAVLVAMPAVFDTSLVVMSRLLARRPILTRGTDHTSHRLLRLGLPTSRVLLVLGGGTVMCSALALAVGQELVPPTPVLVPLSVLAAASLTFLLQVQVYE